MSYYLLALLWATPHWKRATTMIRWIKQLWQCRPFTSWSRFEAGDTVMLRNNTYPLFVVFTTGVMVKLESGPLQGGLVISEVSMFMSHRSLRSEALTVNGRKVWSWL